MATFINGVQCISGAHFSRSEDAATCTAQLAYENNELCNASHNEDRWEVKCESNSAGGCSIAPLGAKPSPTWIEKILKSIGLID